MADRILDAAYLYKAAAKILILAMRPGRPVSKAGLRTALDMATLAISLDAGKKRRRPK